MTMTYISKKIKIIGFTTAFLSVFLPLPILAQESVSFSVSPTIYDMTANPGQFWQSTVRIINPNPFELTLSVTPNNFIPKDEDGIPQFIPLKEGDAEENTLAKWIYLEKEIKIGPEQTLELPFKINVPKDASPGGHYAALLISTKPIESPDKSSRVQTSQVISALIFLRVTGDINENSSIRSFRTANYFLSKPETRFELRVENKGNVHLQPQGEIKIYNMWGSERGVIPINQQTLLGNVLPLSVRKFSFEWSSEWSISDIGRYTAEVALAYGADERQFISANTAFWIIPWKILLVVFAVIGGLVTTITWAIKLYVKHVLALAGVVPGSPRTQALPVSTQQKRTRSQLKAKDITAPIGISILDLRQKLKRARGPWTDKVQVYLEFTKLYWKFFVGSGAILVFIALLSWFILDARSENKTYEVTDPVSGVIISTNAKEGNPILENAQGLPITLVNRTKDPLIIEEVAKKAGAVGFVIATSTIETGAPEEKTVIVYNPEVSSQALLLSRTLDNALLSAFTSTGTSTEKIVVYIGSDVTDTE